VEPEDAIGDGPFIYIALPAGEARVGAALGALPDLIPINATNVLREWEMLLDPIAALRTLARDMFGEQDWVLGDVFVEPTSRTIYLMAEAAGTDEVYEPFAASAGLLLGPGPGQSEVIQNLAGEGRVHNPGLPILLGLAVTAAFLNPIGFHSREARKGF
jgi:hypothetical protein